MSLRHLDNLFRPKSVTLIGASNRPKSIGSIVMRNLLQGGFSGPILPVNEKYKAVAGILAYKDVINLPITPDLGIICTPPETVPDYLDQLGQIGTKTALIMSTDLDKYFDQQGNSLRENMQDLIKKHGMRILGPNCLGLIVPRAGLNASFGHTDILKGQIAFVSQSDSLGIAVLDWAQTKGIGFSNFISLGDCTDIDFADVIDYLGSDPFTSSILLYIENVNNPRKFISAARSASRNKPVVAIKSGILDETEFITSNQTKQLDVSNDEVYEALFNRAGMLRVFDVAELFDAVETMARSRPLKGDRLAILSNGGGPAIMAKDILLSKGGQLAQLTEETYTELKKALEDNFIGHNPIRIIDHAPSEIYAQSLDILLREKQVDAVMVIHVPTAFASSEDIAGAIVNTIGRSRKNIFTIWLGEKDAEQARRIFALAGVPTYETPDQAVRLFIDMVKYRKNQELLMETPDTVPKEFNPDPEAARAIVQNALEEGRTRLSESETKEILSVYAIPTLETRVVEDSEEAVLIAQEFGFPVALKIASPDIKNKLDVGGLVQDLESEEEVYKAADSMLARVAKLKPEAQVDGIIVQKMIRKPEAHELLLGVGIDPDVGPIIVFGQGGAAARVIKDHAVGLPPINMTLAKELIQRTQIYKLLEGYQGQEATDLESIKLTLIQLSQLIIDIPEVVGININPLLADSSGVLVLDAWIEVACTKISGEERLSIRPYPEHLEECVTLKSGLKLLLRPIRPEDEHLHQDFINRLTPEDLRMRFFGYVHDFPHSQLARLTQIDYDREMAFVAITYEDNPRSIGVVRTFFDPDNISAEFAIVVRSDLKTKGLGTLLMEKMLRYSKSRGTKEIMAYTLRENKAMQALGKKFGFKVQTMEDDPETIELKLNLENLYI